MYYWTIKVITTNGQELHFTSPYVDLQITIAWLFQYKVDKNNVTQLEIVEKL